jgi:hypothetical protein
MPEALPLMPGFEKIEPRPEFEPMSELYASAPPVGAGLAEVGGVDAYAAMRRLFPANQWAQAAMPTGQPLQVFDWNIPDPNAGRIRGRYDFSQSETPGAGLVDQVRWRQPGTMSVYDEQGARQWTYVNEHADGSLSDARGRRWYPTEV